MQGKGRRVNLVGVRRSDCCIQESNLVVGENQRNVQNKQTNKQFDTNKSYVMQIKKEKLRW